MCHCHVVMRTTDIEKKDFHDHDKSTDSMRQLHDRAEQYVRGRERQRHAVERTIFVIAALWCVPLPLCRHLAWLARIVVEITVFVWKLLQLQLTDGSRIYVDPTAALTVQHYRCCTHYHQILSHIMF